MSTSNIPWAVGAQQEEPYLDSEEDWSQFMYEWRTITNTWDGSSDFNPSADPGAAITASLLNSQSNGSWSSSSQSIRGDANGSFFSTTRNRQPLSDPSQSITPKLGTSTPPPSSNPSPSGPETASPLISWVAAEELRSTQEACFSCAFCSRRFEKQHLLNRHLEQHLKPVQCPVLACRHRTAKARDMQRHVDARHPSDVTAAPLLSNVRYFCTVWKCKYAKVGFRRRDHLMRHIRIVHRRLQSREEKQKGT